MERIVCMFCRDLILKIVKHWNKGAQLLITYSSNRCEDKYLLITTTLYVSLICCDSDYNTGGRVQLIPSFDYI